MNNDKVKNYLEQIKLSKKFDEEYLECLIKGLNNNVEGTQIANEIIAVMDKRYDENKKDKA